VKLKFTPLVKGMLTGIAMVATSLLLIYVKREANSGAQYLFYLLYAAGITWTLLEYSRSAAYIAKFGSIFGQGFRCFIMVTVVYVIFTGTYAATHPELARQTAENYRQELVKKGNKTPAEIDKEVDAVKNQFVTANISLAIFGSLITGAIFTAAGAGLLLMRRTQ
jgi:hypothetical protein